MPGLSVPVPDLKYEPVETGLTVLEKPLEVRCATVALPDGTAFDQEQPGSAGFFIYRQKSAGAAQEIWNQDAKQWKIDPGALVEDLQPVPLLFKKDDPFPWQGLLIAAGAKDKDENPQFEKAVGAYPRYSFRAFFARKTDELFISGLSAFSLPVRFVSVSDSMRAGIGIPEDEEPEKATEVTLYLRNAARQMLGSVEIRKSGSGAELEISNRLSGGGTGALIRLKSNGDVEIFPAAGRNMVINAPLRAEKIFYQPDSGGAKKWLDT